MYGYFIEFQKPPHSHMYKTRSLIPIPVYILYPVPIANAPIVDHLRFPSRKWNLIYLKASQLSHIPDSIQDLCIIEMASKNK